MVFNEILAFKDRKYKYDSYTFLVFVNTVTLEEYKDIYIWKTSTQYLAKREVKSSQMVILKSLRPRLLFPNIFFSAPGFS